MSKIGKISIAIPEKVKVVLAGNMLNIEGPLGKKSIDIDLEMFNLDIKDGKEISIKPKKIDQNTKRLWGMNRRLINNAVIGSSTGYEKVLELVGVGYRASIKGNKLNLPGHQVIIPNKLPKNQELPLPGLDTDYSTEFGKLLATELKKEKIDVESFNLKSMPELKSWGANREIILKPKNLKFSKDVLSFELNKGAYATVLISHLTKSQ